MKRVIVSCCLVVFVCGPVAAFSFRLSDDDLSLTPVFSSVEDFDFLVRVNEPLRSGAYNNPTLMFVDYDISGFLAPGTPSGFPFFALQRTIPGNGFYDQGSSLSFTIAEDAVFSDGIQMSELVGMDPTFVFNGREVNTGRYHPSLLQLNADGTGSVQNSNNMGGVNPATGMVVDVDFGEEYITDFTFTPSDLTIINGNGVDGDFDSNNEWNCADVDALVAEIVSGNNSSGFDMNFDGVVDASDLTSPGSGWLAVGGRNNLAATGGNPFLVGDANLDGFVDGLDFIEWNNSRFTSNPSWCSGDLDANGFVDGADFILWNENRFTSSDLSAVPEPTCFGWLAVLSLSVFRRRYK